jgi:hypothetical protein
MDIKKIIKAVTTKDVVKAKAQTRAHFELGAAGSRQMNMIAFD